MRIARSALGIALAAMLGLGACEEPAAPDAGPPAVSIVGPSQPDAVPPGDTIVLVGTATDPVDGAIPADGRRWFVNGEERGTGETLTLVLAPAQERLVVLEAVGSDGATGRDSLRLSTPSAGSRIWTLALSGRTAYSPVDRTLVVTRSASVIGLDRRGGGRWTADVADAARAAIASDGRVLVRTDAGELVVLSASGAREWSVTDVSRFSSLPDGRTVVQTNGDTLRVLGPAGSEQMARGAAGRLAFVDGDGRSYTTMNGSDRDSVSVWPASSGAAALRSDLPQEYAEQCGFSGTINPTGMVPGRDDRAYLLLREEGLSPSDRRYGGCIVALYLSTGQTGWAYAAGEAVWTSPPAVDADGNLYLARYGGRVVSVGADGVERWSVDVGDPACADSRGVSTPAVLADGSILLYLHGRVVILDGASGDVLVDAADESPPEDACHMAEPIATADGWGFAVDASGEIHAFALPAGAATDAPWGQAGGGPHRGGSTAWTPPSLP